MTRLDQLSAVAGAAALVWSLIVGVWIWTEPIEGSSVVWTAGPGVVRTVDRIEYRSFSDISLLGPVPLLVPALLASWALWSALRRRIVGLSVAAFFFLVFCFIGGFSIGGAYLPAGLCLIVSTGFSLLNRVWLCRRSETVEAGSEVRLPKVGENGTESGATHELGNG